MASTSNYILYIYIGASSDLENKDLEKYNIPFNNKRTNLQCKTKSGKVNHKDTAIVLLYFSNRLDKSEQDLFIKCIVSTNKFTGIDWVM